MAYTRITALWNGATGLPGYSRFKFVGDLDSGQCAAAAGRVRTFFFNCAGYLPAAINISFSEAAQIFDIEGRLTSELTYTPPALVQGTVSGSFASPAGAVVNWTTGGVQAGRKTRGRTFLVPLASTAFGAAGAPASGTIAAINAAANILAGGTPAMAVHSSKPGAYALTSINGGSVPARASVLRSRRD